MCVMTNKLECQMGVSSRLRGSDAETMAGKVCADLRNCQRICLGGAYRMCTNVVTKKRTEQR